MKTDFKKEINILSIYSATYRANSIEENLFEKYNNYTQDKLKEQRLGCHYCKSCFYICSKIGGAMITHQLCGICGEKMVFSSTFTDCLCFGCAKKYKLCSHCGGDVNQRNRRKFKLEGSR